MPPGTLDVAEVFEENAHLEAVFLTHTGRRGKPVAIVTGSTFHRYGITFRFFSGTVLAP